MTDEGMATDEADATQAGQICVAKAFSEERGAKTAEVTAEGLFTRWLTAVAYANAADCDTEEEGRRRDALADEVEKEIRNAPPSIMRAAAVALIASHYAFGIDFTPSEAIASSDEFDIIPSAWSILEALRSSLHGTILQVTTDWLAHPDRPFGESLLAAATELERER